MIISTKLDMFQSAILWFYEQDLVLNYANRIYHHIFIWRVTRKNSFDNVHESSKYAMLWSFIVLRLESLTLSKVFCSKHMQSVMISSPH